MSDNYSLDTERSNLVKNSTPVPVPLFLWQQWSTGNTKNPSPVHSSSLLPEVDSVSKWPSIWDRDARESKNETFP